MSLKTNLKVLKIKVLNQKFNYLYVLFNSEQTDNYLFYINVNEKEIILYSNEREIVTSFSNFNGTVHINSVSTNKRSAFGECMDAVEEDFTNDLVGWLAWNSNPLYAATAAVQCHGCIKKWWPCPAAYHP